MPASSPGRMLRLLAVLCLVLAGVGHVPAADDQVVHVDKSDPEMNAAIDAARRTLPVFWKAYENPAPDESEFYLKLAITDGHQTEHFWISDITREKKKIFGLVANDPELVKNVQSGQKIEIDEALVSDWKFLKGGKTKGGYTIAVLLKRIPKAEADEIRKELGWD